MVTLSAYFSCISTYGLCPCNCPGLSCRWNWLLCYIWHHASGSIFPFCSTFRCSVRQWNFIFLHCLTHLLRSMSVMLWPVLIQMIHDRIISIWHSAVFTPSVYHWPIADLASFSHLSSPSLSNGYPSSAWLPAHNPLAVYGYIPFSFSFYCNILCQSCKVQIAKNTFSCYNSEVWD